MKRLRLLFLCILIALIAAGIPAGKVWAAMLAEVELEDGSTIRGEILSLGGGVYSLKSSTLGTIEIDQSKVRNIRMKSSQAAESGASNSASPSSASEQQQRPAPSSSSSSTSSALKEQMQALQQHIAGDQGAMKMIQSLQNDAAVQKILQDTELMGAVNSGDVSALLSNPKIRELLSNPTMQEIIKRSTQQ